MMDANLGFATDLIFGHRGAEDRKACHRKQDLIYQPGMKRKLLCLICQWPPGTTTHKFMEATTTSRPNQLR